MAQILEVGRLAERPVANDDRADRNASGAGVTAKRSFLGDSAENAAMDADLADDLERMATALEASGRYRVLRKLSPRPASDVPKDITTRLGLFVDVETTGLDPQRDEIIELAMVPFTYSLDGRVFSVGEPFHGLREPEQPISPAITAITGIDEAMVAGHHIDPDAVAAFAAPAALVVAHNAAFDRRFLERYCETFTTKAWACSMTQVDWVGEGHEGLKLAYLAAGAGFFYERHRRPMTARRP